MSACRSPAGRRVLTRLPTDSPKDAAVPPPIRLPATADDHRVARLAAAAIALSLVDAAIPLPLPGIKPGLANIVTLLVLYRYGLATAVWVSGLRIVAGSLLLGHFLAPGFFLGLAGALSSLLVLAVLRYVPGAWFGPVTLSLAAAFAHIGGQLLLARIWLIQHDAVFMLAPVFFAAAWFFGIINGLIVARLLGEGGNAEPHHA